MSFSLIEDLSAEVTVSGIVVSDERILKATVVTLHLSRFSSRIKLSSSMAFFVPFENFTCRIHLFILADTFIQSDLHLHYIYIYAFSRRFYPKRLTLHSSYSFYILSALAFPGNRTHDLGVANAMLYQLSYRKDL